MSRAPPPPQRTRLSQASLLSLVVALGSAQLGLLSVVDCEASVVDASLLGCSVLVSKPLVLGELRSSPRWLLWLAVLLGHALALVCGLFFLASLAHWLRLRLGGAAAPAAPAARAPGATPPKGPRASPTPRIAESMAEYAAQAEALPAGWSPTVSAASAARLTPSQQGRRSPYALPPLSPLSPYSPYAPRGSPGAEAERRPPILDRHALERYLQSAAPLTRRASGAADGFGHSPAFGPHGAAGGGALGAGGLGAGGLGAGVGGQLFGQSPQMGGAATPAQPLGYAQLSAHGSPLGACGSPLLGACGGTRGWSSPLPASSAFSPACGCAGAHGGLGASPCWATPPASAPGAPVPWSASPAAPLGLGGLSPLLQFQLAMYTPHHGDRLDSALLHAHRAAQLLTELRVSDALLERWRDNMRLWLSAVVLKPLVALSRQNEEAIRREAENPQPPAAPPAAPQPAAGGLFGGGGLGLGGGFGFGGSLGFGAAAAKPAAAPPAFQPGVPMSSAQWLALNRAHPLAQQWAKIQRFWSIPAYAAAASPLEAGEGGCAAYVKRRAHELAQGYCLAPYCWNGGSWPGGGGRPAARAAGGVAAGGGGGEGGGLPTDAEVVHHLFATFMDTVLVPPPPGVNGRPARAAQPAAQPAGGGLLGAAGSLFGAAGRGFGAGAGAGGSSLFGGGAWGAPAAPAATATAAPAAKRNELFWVPAAEMVSFSAQHTCAPGHAPAEQARSSIVIVQRRSPPGSSGAGRGCHYDLLAMGTHWPVRQGEHNLLDCLVLLALFCEKEGGRLGSAHLGSELHTSFREAMLPEPAEQLQTDDPSPYRPLLSVLEPWSEELEQVQLPQVNAALKASAS